MPYARTKIERTNCVSNSEVIPRSLDSWSRAGATIVDATGDIKVKEDTTNVTVHFFPIDQFLGFSGSSGPDQVTCIVSSIAYT